MIVEKRGESKEFEGVWMYLGEKLERERERERERGERESAHKFFFWQNEGSRSSYS